MKNAGKIEKHDARLKILLAAVENTNEAFVTINQQSEVIFFNRAAENLFGYTKEEVIGANLASILMPECRERHELAVARYLETGEGKLLGHESDVLITRKNGEIFPASISFSVTQIDAELFFTGIIRDLTETKKLQEQVIQAERLAALGQVIAEINHEIKNPLILIGGFTRQLVKKASSENDKSKLQMIVNEVDRLENLLGELKELYAPQKKEKEAFELNELLREVFSLVEPNIKDSDIEPGLHLLGQNVMISGDRGKLKQVLINLVQNSVDAMPDGGKLDIRLEQENSEVIILVADTGHGIPDSIREDVLEPFFTTKKKGTGLGLSISKRIIEDQLGGVFAINSVKEKGTVASISLRYNKTSSE